MSRHYHKWYASLKLPNRIFKNIRSNSKYECLKNTQSRCIRILTDEAESDTIEPDNEFDFQNYGDAIVSMVNGSYQKFSIGIYGEWGTGKTTLMRIVERKLRPKIFTWEKVPGEDSDILRNFLNNNFDALNWIVEPSIHFERRKDNSLAIADSMKQNYLSLTLEKQKAVLEINELKKYEFFVEENKETHNLDVKQNDILTVWFNAWRYEREEQFALIPLMKTIAYAMGEHQFYKNIKPIIIRGLEILSKDILRNIATRYLITEKGFEVLIIPGHDDLAKNELVNVLYGLGLTPLILSELPVDSLEKMMNAPYAFVLLSPEGMRDNQILQLGYYAGRMGQLRVCLLVRGGTQLPSDLAGYLVLTYKESIKERAFDITKALTSVGYSLKVR